MGFAEHVFRSRWSRVSDYIGGIDGTGLAENSVHVTVLQAKNFIGGARPLCIFMRRMCCRLLLDVRYSVYLYVWGRMSRAERLILARCAKCVLACIYIYIARSCMYISEQRCGVRVHEQKRRRGVALCESFLRFSRYYEPGHLRLPFCRDTAENANAKRSEVVENEREGITQVCPRLRV